MRTLIAVGGVCLVLGIAGGWTTNGWRLGQQIDRMETAWLREREGHLELLRLEEQRRIQELEQVQHDAQDKIERVTADALAADVAADGLQRELATVRGRLAACAGTAGGSEAARDSGLLLTELLGEVERAGRRLAAEADRRGVAGRACEQAYDAIQP